MLKRNWRYNWLTRRGSRTGHFRSGKLKSAWELAVMLHVSVATFQSVLHLICTSVLTMSKTRLNLTFGGQKGCRHARMSELMWVRCFHLFVQFCIERQRSQQPDAAHLWAKSLAGCRISKIVSILMQAKIYAWSVVKSAYPESNLLD